MPPGGHGYDVVGWCGDDPAAGASMDDERSRLDSIASLDRRAVLVGAGSLAIGGGAVLATSTEDAAAQVTMGSLTIDDARFQSESVTPVADVEVLYEYGVGSAEVATLETRLLADGSPIAAEQLSTGTTTLKNDTNLSGAITDAESLAASDFAPAVGESVTVQVEIAVAFAVLDVAETVIASDRVAESVAITVTHPQSSEYVVEIGAVGEVRTAAE